MESPVAHGVGRESARTFRLGNAGPQGAADDATVTPDSPIRLYEQSVMSGRLSAVGTPAEMSVLASLDEHHNTNLADEEAAEHFDGTGSHIHNRSTTIFRRSELSSSMQTLVTAPILAEDAAFYAESQRQLQIRLQQQDNQQQQQQQDADDMAFSPTRLVQSDSRSIIHYAELDPLDHNIREPNYIARSSNGGGFNAVALRSSAVSTQGPLSDRYSETGVFLTAERVPYASALSLNGQTADAYPNVIGEGVGTFVRPSLLDIQNAAASSAVASSVAAQTHHGIYIFPRATPTSELTSDEVNALLNVGGSKEQLLSYLSADIGNSQQFARPAVDDDELDAYKSAYWNGTHFPSTENKIHVFVHDADDKCQMFSVSPQTTVNEVRIMWLEALKETEETESCRIYTMELGADGTLVETPVDPNSPVDFIKYPGEYSIKLRVRRVPPPRWNVIVSIEGRGVRNVLVSMSTTVEYVTKILLCLEGIVPEEADRWVLCIVKGDGSTLLLYPNLRIFKIGDNITKYVFSKVQKRSAKLAGILGLPSSVVEELATKEGIAAEDELRRRAALSKSGKASALLGLSDGENGGTIRKLGGLRPSLKNIGSSDSLVDDEKNAFAYKNKLKKDNLVLSAAKKNVANKVKNGSTDSLGHLAAEQSEDTSSQKEEPTRRTDKLADFFGVKKPKDVNQMKSALTTTASSEISYTAASSHSSDNMGYFNAKIHFANMTYLVAKMNINAVAHAAKSYVLDELKVSESADQYGLYVYSPDTFGERLLGDDEKLYDTMIAWEHDEIFLFKRKNISLIRTQTRSSIQSSGHNRSNLSLSTISQNPIMRSSRTLSSLKVWMEHEKNVVPERRVAKLAGFFGIQISAPDKDGSNEMSELYKVMSALVSKDGGDGINPKALEKTKNINIAAIRREGWLQYYGAKKTWESCWASVEKDILKLTPSSRNAVINQNGVITYITLEGASIEKNPNSPKKHSFTIIDRRGNRHLLCASSQSEVDDWVLSTRQTAQNDPEFTKRSTKTVKERNSGKDADNIVEKVYQQSFVSNGRQVVPQKLSIEDFEIHKVIGRGKYAKVLLCCRKSTGKMYAIKVIYKSAELGEVYESRILRSIQHPFIVSLHYAFQTADRLYLVMEYVNGGELYFHVSNFGRFAEDRVRFYAAEILLALECLHSKGILYRDLKLENILLHRDGHIKIADFGLSIESDLINQESNNSIIGTLEYLAPEILLGGTHTAASDYWAFGVVIYEMLCGSHPFYSDNHEEIEMNILNAEIKYPKWVTAAASNLIAGLFDRNPEQRLGASTTLGIREIKEHPFFYGINWEKMMNKAIEVPFKPDLTDDFDVSFFDEQFTGEYAGLTPIGSEDELPQVRDVDGFSFVGDRE